MPELPVLKDTRSYTVNGVPNVQRRRQQSWAKAVFPPPAVEIFVGWNHIQTLPLEEAKTLHQQLGAAIHEAETGKNNDNGS